MNKFNIGDRVKVYFSDKNGMTSGSTYGVIEDVNVKMKNIAVSEGPFEDKNWYHIKQCRRLKPKKPRRRIWVPKQTLLELGCRKEGETVHGCLSKRQIISADVEFIEVRKKVNNKDKA